MICEKYGSEKLHESGFITKRQSQNCPDCGRFMRVNFNGVITFFCGNCLSEKPFDIKVSTYLCEGCSHIQEVVVV